VNDGVATIDKEIAPQATITIDAPLDTKNSLFTVVQQPPQRYYSPWGGGGNIGPSDRPNVSAVADLASDRSNRVEKLLRQYRDTACVYAECEAAPDTVKLDRTEAKRQHQQVIRSLVHLERKDVIATTRLQVISPKSK
jgi:hypothetical protein